MHFRDIPWTAKTRAVLNSLWQGRRSVWFDFDGTITYKIPAPEGWEYDKAAVDYALGYAGTCLGLFGEGEQRERYYQLLDQLKHKTIDYDAFFSRTERECIVRQIDENSPISKNLGITSADLDPFRRQQDIANDKPVLMCAELMEFIGYKTGLHLADRGLINNEVLDVIHDFQGKKVSGHKVHIDVITAASEDFNHGVMRAAVERYNAVKPLARQLEMPDIFLGKQFRYVDGAVTYTSEKAEREGVETEINTEQPESLRKWYLMEEFKSRGAEIIAMFGDSIKWLSGDDAALNFLRDKEGNRIKKTETPPKKKNFLKDWREVALNWLYGGKEPVLLIKTDSPHDGFEPLYYGFVAIGERHSNKSSSHPDVLSGLKEANMEAALLRSENEDRLREAAALEAEGSRKFGLPTF